MDIRWTKAHIPLAYCRSVTIFNNTGELSNMIVTEKTSIGVGTIS